MNVTTVHGFETNRKYDQVAESLYRIQNKLIGVNKKRNDNMFDNVSRISQNNSYKEELHQKWNSNWEKKN